MTKTIVVMMLAALGAAAADDGVALFDGRTLKGWNVASKPADRDKNFWSVKDGAIVCDSLGRKDHDYVWLLSAGEYGDFELRLEVRGFRESPGNSGVQVRSRYDYEAGWLDGPQIDVHPPGPWRTGLIYDETRGVRHWIFPSLPDSKIVEAQGPPKWKWDEDGWNQIAIVCRGTRITTTVNAVRIADFDGAGLLDDTNHRARNVGLKGHLALQLHIRDELRIAYRAIRIRELTAP
jgi:hypothetical protein